MAKIVARSEISAQEIVTGVKQIATLDLRTLMKRDTDDNGHVVWRPRLPHELPPTVAQALDGFKMKPGKYGTAIEYKTAGRMAAYDLLARYKGMLKEPDRPPIVGNIQINF